MKRGFFGSISGRVSTLVAVLCSIFILAGTVEAQTSACPARKVKVLWVANENWRSNLIVESPSGGKLPIADCTTSLATARLIAGGTIVVNDFDSLRCGSTLADVAGVAELELDEGVCASYTTEGVYRDALGNLSIVTIPELDAAIAVHETVQFRTLVNDGERSTFLAIFLSGGGSTTLHIKTFEGSTGAQTGHETVVVGAGFNFYELASPILMGTIVVENRGSQVGPETGGSVDVVAFTGYRAGGGPRVVLHERGEPTS